LKIGIATSVYINYPIDAAIQLISEAGYECVDIWGGRPHIYRNDYSADELKNLKAQIIGCGMSVSSFMPAFFRYPHNLCSPNPRVWNDSLDYVYQSMDNASILGAPLLLVCPARLMKGQNVSEAWERMAKSLQLVCDRANPMGIKVVLEPVNKQVFDLINNATDAMRMIKYVGIENLGVILDSGHLLLSDETVNQALNLIGDRLFQVHVNDNDGWHQQNLVPGDRKSVV
jgi:protein FrlC